MSHSFDPFICYSPGQWHRAGDIQLQAQPQMQETEKSHDSAVHLHLKDKGCSSEDITVHILDRADRWDERDRKAIVHHLDVEQPLLNRAAD